MLKAKGKKVALQVAKLNAFCRQHGMRADVVRSAMPAVLPVRVLHPHTASSVRGVFDIEMPGAELSVVNG